MLSRRDEGSDGEFVDDDFAEDDPINPPS